MQLLRCNCAMHIRAASAVVFSGVCRSYFYNDVLVFDMRTSKLSPPPRAPTFPKGISGRANHTATLVGSKIWFIGGGDVDDVFDEVFTLDVNTWAWQVVAVRWGVLIFEGGRRRKEAEAQTMLLAAPSCCPLGGECPKGCAAVGSMCDSSPHPANTRRWSRSTDAPAWPW